MKKMPIGIDDFKTLRDGDYYFVDKTGFIGHLIDGHGQVTLITRPRRFGKTLTMSMLYYFFTNKDADENRELFEGCQIANSEYMKEQGQYPVIFISLKEAQSLRYELTLDILAGKLQDLYGRYDYLLDSLSEKDKKTFRAIWLKEASEGDLQLSLERLIHYLYNYHKKKVILLIDEYDVMIQSSWENDYYKDAITFMRNFLSAALKSNTALHFAVLTGVLRIAKESIFSALNNLEVSSVSEGSYADVFGFTSDEVARMADDLGVPDKMAEIREWYDGYSFSGHEIYNPWSVINYFKRCCKAAPYWVNTSGNSILKVLLTHIDAQRESELKGLLGGETVDAALSDAIVYNDIYKSRDALYTMLMTAGYLKCIERWKVRGKYWGRLAIPNSEVLSVFEQEVLQNMAGKLGAGTLYMMMEAMMEGDAKTFESHLANILRENVSVHDAAHPESFYHGMMLGLLVLLQEHYEVVSNGEGGYGRFDIAFIPRKADKSGVFMEFKRAKDEDSLDAKAKEALNQIAEKEYIAALTKRGVQKIWQYGIAFCGKRVRLVRG